MFMREEKTGVDVYKRYGRGMVEVTRPPRKAPPFTVKVVHFILSVSSVVI